MKNTIKVLSIIAVLAVVALSMTACDPGFDNVEKSIKITDLPISGANSFMNKQLIVAIAEDKDIEKLKAWGIGTVSKADFTITLESTTVKNDYFKGTGKFFIYLFLDRNGTNSNLKDDEIYVYVGPYDDVTGNKYNLTEEQSVIAFDQFKKISS